MVAIPLWLAREAAQARVTHGVWVSGLRREEGSPGTPPCWRLRTKQEGGELNRPFSYVPHDAALCRAVPRFVAPNLNRRST